MNPIVLAGVVVDIGGKNGKVTVARLEEGRPVGQGKLYECYYQKYTTEKSHLESGDIVTFIGDPDGMDKFIVRCIAGVDLPTSAEAFKRSIIRMVPRQGFDGFKAEKLYDYLTEMASQRGLSGAEDMLSYIANCDRQGNDQLIVEKFKRLTYQQEARIVSLMTSEQSRTILDRWSYMRDRRTLLAMGLKDKEIDTSGYTEYDLLKQLRTNPYLVASIDGEVCKLVDFYTRRTPLATDKICHEIKRRIYMNTFRKGWTCTSVRHLTQAVPDIDRYVEALTTIYEVIVEYVPIYADDDSISEEKKSIGTDKVFYLKEQYNIEKRLAELIIKRVTDAPYFNLGEPIFSNDKLDPDQRSGIRTALNNNISIITGPAGSGKTTMLKELCKNLDMHGIKYAVCSLTGKAVVRAKQLGGLGDRAATMHRMLYGNAVNGDFKYLIIDEATMVNNKLMYDFLKDYPDNYPILMIGDVNQLQPIDWGSFFCSCINSRSIPTTRLTNIHRVITSDGYQDGIIKNSSAIANWPDGSMYVFSETPNFQKIECPGIGLAKIVQECKNNGIKPMDITIICPYRRGYGIPELNRLCQLIWNNGNKSVKQTEDVEWIVGDRVMMLKNNYDVDVCNGQEGIIVDVSPTGVSVNFPFIQKAGTEHDIAENAPCVITHTGSSQIDGVEMVSYDKIVTFSFSVEKSFYESKKDPDADTSLSIDNIVLSYVISVHKSQGSEWPYVVYFLPASANMNSTFISRPITYVGITRGSKLVWIAGSPINIVKSISRGAAFRCEMLKDRLKHELPRLYNKEIKEFKFDEPVAASSECYEYDAGEDDDWL